MVSGLFSPKVGGVNNNTPVIDQPRTKCEVVRGELLGSPYRLSPVVPQRDDLGFYSSPSKIAFEGSRYVGLATRRQSDGDDKDLSCMEKEPRSSCV